LACPARFERATYALVSTYKNKKPLSKVVGRGSFKFYFFVNSKQEATFGLAVTWV